MGELIAFPERHESYLAKAERLRWEAVMAVTSKYGDGYDDSEVSPDVRMLSYHNMQHTQRVIKNAQQLAQIMKCDEHLIALAMLAAAAHDIIQEGSRGDMEALSAEWLSGRMTAEGFDADDIAACTAAILGTTPIVDCDGVMADQYVNQITYPSKRAQTIAQIVASADMGDLYQSYGPLLGRDIYKEELGSDDDNPQLDSAFMQSQHRQLQLLQNYRYPTAIAETVFGKDRQRIVGYQREISRMIADGQITTWQQLTDTDIAFSELFDIGT